MIPSPDLSPWEERALTAQVHMHALEARLASTTLVCQSCHHAQSWALPVERMALRLMAPLRCFHCNKVALRDMYGTAVFAEETESSNAHA
jgi:hypothetical protein